MTRLKVALIGLGRAGWGMHCRNLDDREDKYELFGCYDVLPDRMEMMKEKYTGIKTYTSFEDAVNDPEVDLVDIATPSTLHAEQAITALKAGKTVFLEKPIATSLADAKEMVKVAEETGSKLFFRHNRRFETPFQHVREIIDSGKLGEVFEIRLHRQSYSRRADWQTLKSCGGGQLNNWGPHIIDHSLQLLGAPVKSLWSNLKLIAAAGDAEDHLKIIFQGENDRIVDMEISGGVSIGQPTYIVHGTKGTLVQDDGKFKLRYLDPFDKLSEVTSSPESPALGGGFGNRESLRWITEEIDPDPKLKVSTDKIWDYLYDSITTGAEFPVKTEEALAVMEVIDEVKAGTQFA